MLPLSLTTTIIPPTPDVFEDDSKLNISRLPLFRDREHFDNLTEYQIKDYYTLDKEQIEYIHLLLYDDLKPKRWRFGVLSPLQVILTALAYLASGSLVKVGYGVRIYIDILITLLGTFC